MLGLPTEVVSFSEVVDLVGVVIWPLVVLTVIAIAVTDRGRLLLRPILRRVRKISGGGFALELTPEAAVATKADVEGAVRAFSGPLGEQFEILAYSKKIRIVLGQLVNTLHPAGECKPGCGHRATVYVSDALYRDGLYQLVDYWPAGGGSGRRFSLRFGILGRAWRLEETLYDPTIPADNPEELIGNWGMTREQAEQAGRGRQSFFCATLKDDSGILVGAVYMDSMLPEAFPGIEERSQDGMLRNLGSRVGEVHRDIAALGPSIKVLQSD